MPPKKVFQKVKMKSIEIFQKEHSFPGNCKSLETFFLWKFENLTMKPAFSMKPIIAQVIQENSRDHIDNHNV